MKYKSKICYFLCPHCFSAFKETSSYCEKCNKVIENISCAEMRRKIKYDNCIKAKCPSSYFRWEKM